MVGTTAGTLDPAREERFSIPDRFGHPTMKSLSGRAEGTCRASIAAAAQLLRAVDDYPRWHPEGVRRVVVLERDPAGSPQTLEATLRVAVGPIARDVELTLAVSAPDATA